MHRWSRKGGDGAQILKETAMMSRPPVTAQGESGLQGARKSYALGHGSQATDSVVQS